MDLFLEVDLFGKVDPYVEASLLAEVHITLGSLTPADPRNIEDINHLRRNSRYAEEIRELTV